MSTKDIGTLCSRQNHFIKFLSDKKLGKNVALKGFTLNVRNIIMACYTVSLATGNTLMCKTIASGTLKRYLGAAAELSRPANMMNPCLDIMGKQSRYISDIIKELKRWESIPNRREPVTKEMIEYIIAKGKLNKKNPDNLYSAFGDWLVLNEQSGCRRKEWAQDRTYLKKHKDIQRNIDGSSAAFILKDFEFRGNKNKRINNSSIKEVNKAVITNIEWRFQKNLDNGQVISYIEDTKYKLHCAVTASKRIYRRAKRLKIAADKPIAVFIECKGKKKICFIDDVHITTILREAASKVHNITCKKELAKFTSHSIRVGACVFLHAQNASKEDIKFRLRWRSDSFRMYLRNIIQLAERHRDVIRAAQLSD